MGEGTGGYCTCVVRGRIKCIEANNYELTIIKLHSLTPVGGPHQASRHKGGRGRPATRKRRMCTPTERSHTSAFECVLSWTGVVRRKPRALSASVITRSSMTHARRHLTMLNGSERPYTPRHISSPPLLATFLASSPRRCQTQSGRGRRSRSAPSPDAHWRWGGACAV